MNFTVTNAYWSYPGNNIISSRQFVPTPAQIFTAVVDTNGGVVITPQIVNGESSTIVLNSSGYLLSSTQISPVNSTNPPLASFTPTGITNGTQLAPGQAVSFQITNATSDQFLIVYCSNTFAAPAPADYTNTVVTWYQTPVASLLITSSPRLFPRTTSSQMKLSWPSDHIGYWLEVQTNSLASGLSANWFAVPDSNTTNLMTMPINPSNGSVFYRLRYP